MLSLSGRHAALQFFEPVLHYDDLRQLRGLLRWLIGSLESRAAARSLLDNKPATLSEEIEQAIKRYEEWNALPKEEREARLREQQEQQDQMAEKKWRAMSEQEREDFMREPPPKLHGSSEEVFLERIARFEFLESIARLKADAGTKDPARSDDRGFSRRDSQERRVLR